MCKNIYFTVAVYIYILLLQAHCLKAQQELGQIVINAGVGYSPEFDGNFSLGNGTLYPIKTILPTFPNYNDPDDPPYFNCNSIIPNLGGIVDIGLSEIFSVGIASSFQSEIVNWATESNAPSIFSDKVTRINVALRFLYHLPLKNKHFDPYFGIRLGRSLWHDIPSSSNLLYPIYPSENLVTFINSMNETVNSFQILCGTRIYLFHNLGIHFEAALGSPYLAEGGLTFKINTHKRNMAQDTI